MAEEKKTRSSHRLVLEDRGHLHITGVLDVITFDEENIISETEMGTLVLKGSDLHVTRLNLDEGELIIDGHIDDIEYADDSVLKGKGSLFSKLFK